MILPLLYSYLDHHKYIHTVTTRGDIRRQGGSKIFVDRQCAERAVSQQGGGTGGGKGWMDRGGRGERAKREGT